ncbi:MAG: DUF5666 domain-containing protein [Gammaproteobacteria bacterium]|jgi:hypothetical protein|nr:DUF5666 domain-containing protein [Gammaproteobacteria bacterium]MDH3751692.1 DUF5666 domain-containing protein [Gammaproteobacteria bacterium]MDH3806285.1 DUF5666 domain-containing protein [Gammaproteobacteria bacterium]
MKNGLILTTLVVLIASACSDSSSNTTPAPAPVVTPEVVVAGPITAFGSVIANGVEFDTTSAIVTMDGEPGIVSDLRIGMVVSIHGTVGTTTEAARASEIRFVDDAEGPISSIDRAAGSFVVLGRTILVDELTVFEDTTFETLAAGNVVQASGLWRSQERVQATHVHRIANAYAAGMTMEVKGVISALDIGNQRFNIGTQSCDYSAAMLELGGADLANGMYVQVTSTAMIQNGHMLANMVQTRDRDRDRHQLCAGECLYELIGYVTAFETAEDFEVDGQALTTTPDTVYVNGTVDTLALDVKVSIDGTLNDAGVLVAERIVFHLPSLVEIKADVENLLAGYGLVRLLGIDVQTNEFTLFRDHTTSGPPTFGFGDLVVGDRVEIRAVLDGDSVIASRLERDDPDSDVTLKALVESIARPSIVMLGVTVTSDQNTVFQNAAHQVIDADAFFALVDIDSLVRTEGVYDGTSILASKMFLRECVNDCL